MTKPDLGDIRRVQGLDNREFFRKMDNRMMFGFFRYNRQGGGLVPRYASGAREDWIGHMKQKLRQYERTGNTELLVDIANAARGEYQFPSHPEAHFDPVATERRDNPSRCAEFWGGAD